MPNHIKNRIELIGSSSDISSFIEKYSTFYPKVPSKSYDGLLIYKNTEGVYGYLDENTQVFSRRDKDSVLGVPEGFIQLFEDEWTRLPDFEKVFPVPEIIKLVGDSVEAGIINAVYNKYKHPLNSNHIIAGLEAINRSNVKLKPEDELQFQRACKAYEETGFAYWYDYQIAKWGTKWNSYSCEKISDSAFVFETAWSGVPDLVLEMSKNFNGTILYKYADEDTGYNTGYLKICSGLIIEENIPAGGSKESYDLAFELRPDSRSYYELVDGEYQYKDED